MAGLYIDHGWDMGWCVRTRHGVASGVLHLRVGNPTDGARLLAATDWFTALLVKLERAGERLTEIRYEQITFVGKNDADTVHAHGKQLGNLQRWATLKKQPDPRGIEWNIIKKHVSGHGSAAREKVLEIIQGHFPRVTDHNQASAVAVMLTATNQHPFHSAGKPPHARQAKRASP